MEPVVKRLLGACKPWLTAYCPTMDLVATASEAGSVDVWRFNGQRVFGLAAEDGRDREVEGLSWKADGRMLAVALGSGSLILLDTFAGKVAHRFAAAASDAAAASLPDWSATPVSTSPSPVDHAKSSNLTWISHSTMPLDLKAASRPGPAFDQLSHTLLGCNGHAAGVPKTAGLPHVLSCIDIESSLPKLSTLPPTGADDDIFSSRAAIDSVFHSGLGPALSSSSGDQVGMIDMLLHRRRYNEVSFRMFDSFEIGSIDLASALPKGLAISRTLATVGHPLLSDYYFVVQTEPDGVLPRRSSERARHKGSLQLLRVQLLLLNQTSQHLPLLAAKATQLQNLLRYLQQIQVQLASEVRTAFDLPRRFLANVQESLAGDGSGSSGSTNFITAAYHLVVTGECDPRLKEWLVDEVGERGLKRWEKAVGDCLDLIRRMASECLLPAVERCQVVLSRLEGLARFDDTASKLGLSLDHIRPIRETFDALALLCEDMLRDVCVESREFGAFIKWLKWEAEVEGLGEDSERAEEMREAFSGEAELPTVMDYIDGPAFESRVLKYVEANDHEITDNITAPPASARAKGNDQFYSMFKRQRQKRDDDHHDQGKRLPRLGALVRRLRSKTDIFLQHVAETLRKSLLLSNVVELGATAGDKIECRIFGSKANTQRPFELHIMSTHSAEGPSITHTVVALDSTVLTQSAGSITRRVLSLPSAISRVYDAKWAPDGSLLVLVGVDDGDDRQVLRDPVGGGGGGGRDGDNSSWDIQHSFSRGLIGAGMVAGWLSLGEKDGGVVVSDDKAMGFAVFGGT